MYISQDTAAKKVKFETAHRKKTPETISIQLGYLVQ
jgi:hypothetical protein